MLMNIEPIMLDTAGVRNIATADPDSTATTSTFTVTGFNTNASSRVISIDYVLAGTEDTITLTTDSTVAKASSNATTIGTSDVTSATHLASAIVTALVADNDFTGTATDGTVAFGVASSGADITFTVGDATVGTNDDLNIGDGIAGIRTETEATQGIVVGASEDTFDLTVGEQAVTNLAITQELTTPSKHMLQKFSGQSMLQASSKMSWLWMLW